MNVFNYVVRQLGRLKIDLLTQRTFLAGQIPSIDNAHIIKTVSTNYEELDIIFSDYLQLQPGDVIADVGCGKGRVFSYLLYKKKENRMIGYEINELVGHQTKKRLSRYKNIEIRCENIFDNFPEKLDVFYLYNPFKEAMTTAFIEKVLQMPHAPVIIYNNPIHLNLFTNDKFTCQVFDIPVKKYKYNFQFAIIKPVANSSSAQVKPGVTRNLRRVA